MSGPAGTISRVAENDASTPINSVGCRSLEGHTNFRKVLPRDAALSKGIACIERKLEFGGKACGAREVQAGTVTGQIADDTIERRAAGHNYFGAFEYFGSRKPPTLKHGKKLCLEFDENDFRPNLFQN